MKLNAIVFSLVFSGFIFGSAGRAQELTEQIKLEGEIEGRLARKIGFVLAPELYKIIVNAKMQAVTEKIVLEGETSSQKEGSEANKAESALPGFQLIEDPKAKTDKVEASKSKFRYNKYLKLLNVDVHLILDDSVSAEKKEYVETLAKQDLDSSYGDKGHLLVKQFKLIEQQLPFHKAVTRWFVSYLDKRGGSAIDLLYVVAIFSMILLFIVATAIRVRRIFKKTVPVPVKAGGTEVEKSSEKNEYDIAIDAILNHLVERISSNPLPVRCFLKQLQESNKKVLLAATKTPALTTYFQQLLDYYHQPDVKEVKDRKDLKAKLALIQTDLERFLKIQTQQEQQQFGYLPLLDDQQIFQFVNSEPDKILALNVLCKFLSKPQFVTLSNRLTVDEKVKLFKSLKEVEPSEADLDHMDRQLRAKFEKLKGHSAVLAAEAHEIEKEFLENDSNVALLVERLLAENYPLGPGFEKYQITFDQLFAQDKDVLRRVIEKVSNETLAKAFGKQPLDGTVKESLGEMRGKLIDSMRNRYRALEHEEVQKAKVEILKIFWAIN